MKKIILSSVIAMFAVCVLNAQTTTTTTTTPAQDNPNAPVITFDSLVHDFGVIEKRTDPANCEFTFKNTGKEPLILSDVKTSCGCTVPSWTKEPVLPGKTGVIKVSYTKTSNVGPIGKQITVTSNAKNPTVVLSIKGTVVDNTPATPEKTTNDVLTPQK